jgi:hypothetical protein
MKKKSKKLVLTKETVWSLSRADLEEVAGGFVGASPSCVET